MNKLYIVGILTMLFIGGFFILKSDDGMDDRPNIQAIPNTTPTLQLSKQLVNTSVKIDSVTLTTPSYVVIREVVNGKLAQIAEVSPLLPIGTTENIEIKLFDTPRDDVSLIAIIYEDDGDAGFNPSLDTRAIRNGAPVAYYVETAQEVPSTVFSPTSVIKGDTNIAATITYTDTGYTPTTVTIEKGQTVAFVNKSSVPMWAASNPHPAHTILPSFDQFEGTAPGTTYTYTFDEVGTWNFHDHINPTSGGSVIVTEPTAPSLLNVPSVPALEKNEAGYMPTDADTFAQLADNPEVTMVNVHIPFAGKIPGTELSIPYNQTQQLLDSLPSDKNAPIALYCRSGGMSAVASRALIDAGYTNVYDLTGGMIAYEKSGRELLTN